MSIGTQLFRNKRKGWFEHIFDTIVDWFHIGPFGGPPTLSAPDWANQKLGAYAKASELGHSGLTLAIARTLYQGAGGCGAINFPYGSAGGGAFSGMATGPCSTSLHESMMNGELVSAYITRCLLAPAQN